MRSMTWPKFPPRRPEDGEAVADDAAFADPDPAVEEVLAALTSEPRPHELDGLAQTLSAYRAAVPDARVSHATTARRASVLTGLLTAKAAAAFAGAALGLGATAVAVALSLPPTAPNLTPVSPAASTPAATSAATPGDDGEGVGPDATGPAAHGLCTAWSRHKANGETTPLDSVAMRNLAEAAGGASKVEAYCATIEHPGEGRSQDAKNKVDKDKGKPATTPSGPKPKPTTGSQHKPSTPAAPTGKPTPSTPPKATPAPSPKATRAPSPTGSPT